jgi:hypothetical protein
VSAGVLPRPYRTRVSSNPCDRCGGKKRYVPYGSPYCLKCLEQDLDEAFLNEHDVAPTRSDRGGTGNRQDSEQFPALPPRALVQAIERRMDSVRAQRSRPTFIFRSGSGSELPDDVREDVCASLGISSKAFRDWQSGRVKRVSFDVYDMILTRADWLWWEIEGNVRPPAERGRPNDVSRWIDEAEENYRFIEAVFEATETSWHVYVQAA